MWSLRSTDPINGCAERAVDWLTFVPMIIGTDRKSPAAILVDARTLMKLPSAGLGCHNCWLSVSDTCVLLTFNKVCRKCYKVDTNTLEYS